MTGLCRNPNIFPITPEVWATHPDFHGLTLRDYFAGQALPSVILAMQNGLIGDHPIAGGGTAGFAASAYEIADAMLDARVPT